MSTDRTALPTGTVTFLFTDIQGSTRLWGRAPQAMNDALAMHDALFREVVPAHRGVIFKTVGDAMCAVFTRADDAIYAAIDAQRKLAVQMWPAETGPLLVRMGIHTGQAIERDNDYFGPALNRVARLMSIAHGGQAIASRATVAVVDGVLRTEVGLRDLGSHRLSDLTEPETAFQILADGLAEEFPPLRSVDHHPNNLPSQISSFIGRTEELASLDALLREHRLVTVVGPGGIGKTRIALQQAAASIADYAGGTWFVELAALNDGKLIAPTIASALSIAEEGDEPLDDRIVHRLGEKRVLLVLDNSEHLLTDVATIAKRLLAACPSLRILTTSREPLFVTGEYTFRLAPLSSSGVIADAVQLFIERARGADPNVASGQRALESIGRICRSLEGIPLAIELAAARAGALRLSDIESRLNDRLSLLVSRDVTQAGRHRTLRAAIDWSYTLLSADERRFARAVAIFEGYFRADDAVAVAMTPAAVDLLESLNYKSLIATNDDGPFQRYAISDMIREFLREAADDPAEAATLRARHFDHYVSRVVAGADQADASGRAEWIHWIESAVADVRSALEWGFCERPADVPRFVLKLSAFWQFAGHLIEGERCIERALALPNLKDVDRAPLLRRASTFATMRSHHDAARTLIVAARDAYERLADRSGIAETTYNIAVIEHRLGRASSAEAQYLEALGAFTETGHRYGEVRTRMNLVLLALERGDVDAARSMLESASGTAQTLNDDDLDSDIDTLRAMVLCADGFYADSIALYRSILDDKRSIGNRYAVADLLAGAAEAHIGLGDLPRAIDAVCEIFDIAAEIETPGPLINAFEASAEVLVRQSRWQEAARSHSYAIRLRARYQFLSGNVGDERMREEIIRAHALDVETSQMLDDRSPVDQAAVREATNPFRTRET